MGYSLLLILAEIFGLWIVSKKLIRQLFTTVLTVFRSRPFAVSLITALLFPGTVIHELSHLFSAEILGVRTGKLTLAPESIEQENINVGSVEFRQTDPFRRSVIGLAPFLVGLTALFVLSSILPNLWNDTLTAYNGGVLFSSPSFYFLLFTLYFVFCISNTMFASSQDMKGVIPLAVVLGILGTAAYVAGIRFGITGELEEKVVAVLFVISKSLSVVLLLNLFLYALTSTGVWIGKRIRKN